MRIKFRGVLLTPMQAAKRCYRLARDWMFPRPKQAVWGFVMRRPSGIVGTIDG